MGLINNFVNVIKSSFNGKIKPIKNSGKITLLLILYKLGGGDQMINLIKILLIGVSILVIVPLINSPNHLNLDSIDLNEPKLKGSLGLLVMAIIMEQLSSLIPSLFPSIQSQVISPINKLIDSVNNIGDNFIGTIDDDPIQLNQLNQPNQPNQPNSQNNIVDTIVKGLFVL
jgi:hypothetical protein